MIPPRKRSDGTYDTTAPPCNEAAASGSTVFSILMLATAVGYVTADVAADALTVQYARREPLAYLARCGINFGLVIFLGIIYIETRTRQARPW